MAEPLRRRLRARLLQGLQNVPDPLLRAGLDAVAGLGRFTRYERIARANLELALGDETSAREREEIARGVRGHSARILHEWLRLARGDAEAWVARTVELDPSVERLTELSSGERAGPGHSESIVKMQDDFVQRLLHGHGRREAPDDARVGRIEPHPEVVEADVESCLFR